MGDSGSQTVTSVGSQRVKPDVIGRLVAVHPPEIVLDVQLGPALVVLGRRSDGVVAALNHATVSRRHAGIEWSASLRQHVVEDLGSRNGSSLDGALLTERRALVDGSVLRLGDVLAVYERGPAWAGPPSNVTPADFDAVPGTARAMRRLRADLGVAARDPSPALLVGETGTGKELSARELHRLSGRSGPFLDLNCAELSSQLIESQLFGHEKGAFTGATGSKRGLFWAANGGTLFLDEIGELPLDLQPKLLRVLQERRVRPVGSTSSVAIDVRVVSATNRDLAAEAEAGTFRRDLYARLALWELRLPPVRERRCDIIAWVERLHAHWLSARPSGNRAPIVFEAAAAERILLAPWRDNLRGLDRLVHRLASRARDGGVVTLEDIAPLVAASDAGPAAGAAPDSDAEGPTKRPAPRTREEFEAVFERLGRNVRATAKHYGRDRRQVYRWLERWQLKE